MKRVLIFCAIVWVAFAGMGLALHESCEGVSVNPLGWVDIAGYDSEAYVRHHIRMCRIAETMFRHPLMGVVLAPIITVCATVADRFGPEAGCRTVIVCFALIGTANVLLLWLLMKKLGATLPSRVGAVALWLAFAHVWILGGVAESFGVSMPLLLGTLYLVAYGVRDLRVWGMAGFLTAGVTITNGIKPLLVWLTEAGGWKTVRRMSRESRIRIAATAVGCVCLAGALLAAKWTFLDGIGMAGGMHALVADVRMYFTADIPFARRCWLVWNAFWCEPMLLHGTVIGKSTVTTAYAGVLPHVACLTVFFLCLWSAIANRSRPVIRAALLMVSFDFLLHVVAGWGLEEGQIYCGHWLWIVPLLVGCLPGRVACAIIPTALYMAWHNLAVIM